MRSPLILLCLQLWGNVQVSLSQNVTCPKLPDVPHGHLSEETKQAEYQAGDVIHFTCEIGYISGPTIRYVCTSTGWIAVHKGRCFLKPCELPDETPNGYYQIIHGEDFVFGTTIKYFCNEGYQMVSKEDTRTCLLEQWTNRLPVCDPLSCDPPPEDLQATVQHLPENEDLILPDRFITFSCDDPQQRLNGSSVLICGKDGQWDKPFPSCEDITCEVPVMHHHLIVNGPLPANGKMKVGHKLQFQCSPHDQYTLDGPAEIECLQTGQWNAPFPTCSENCKVTGEPGNVLYTPRSQYGRKGEKLTFFCRWRGQFLQGNKVIECRADGQWSDPFPTCGDPVGCKKPPLLADGDTKETSRFSYRHNERVEYICQNYYTMEGDPHKTCINGEWSGEMRCLKPCTVNTEAMSRHNIAFKYTHDKKLYSRHNEEIEFRCVGRRRHDGRLNMRQRCRDGVMQLPSCW